MTGGRSLDLFISNYRYTYDEDNFLYANNGNSNSWININCEGTVSNVFAIGAKVKVNANIGGYPIWQLREISGGIYSQDSLNAEFGLGDASVIDEIRVEWPSGIVQTIVGESVNQFLTITESETYEFVSKWGTYGTGDGEFHNPYDIAFDSSGNIYVVDSYNHRIQKFDSNEILLGWWGLDDQGYTGWHDPGSGRTGTIGNGDGQFYFPCGIAVDSSGYVYVAELNERIQKFTSDGVFIGWWGLDDQGYTGWHDPGSGRTAVVGYGPGQFYHPQRIAIDSSGYVYVTEKGNHRIQKFTSNGTFIAAWGGHGTGDGRFIFPCGVAVDNYGYVYVADSGNDRIQKFTSNGTFITKWGTEGTGDGQIDNPLGVAVDSYDYVYVTDVGNSRVQKFQKKQ